MIVSASERAEFGGRFFRKAETEINERDVAADGNDVVNEGAEHAGEEALHGPWQAIGQAEAGQGDPHGPVLGEPEAIFFAGAAHEKCRSGGRLRAAVELRVERGVVIHLELEIDGERAAARDDVGEKFGEAVDEIGALDADARELLAAFLAVFGRGVGAHGFLVHVIFLEREDGETVDHHARRFGIAWAAGRRRLERGDDGFVHFFDEIVTLLIEAIDVALRAIDGLEAEVVATGDILFVPELKIAQVILLNEECETFAGRGGRDVVPARGEVGLQCGGVGGGKTHA